MKKVISVFVLLTVLFMSTSASLAFFTDYDTAKNARNTVLGGQASLNEEFDNLSKIITLENTGETYLFASLSVVYPDAEYLYGIKSISVECSESWVKGSDGLYYYKNVLAPGETADGFRVNVVLADGINSDNADIRFDIIVNANYAQAAYTDNEPDMNLSWSLTGSAAVLSRN